MSIREALEKVIFDQTDESTDEMTDPNRPQFATRLHGLAIYPVTCEKCGEQRSIAGKEREPNPSFGRTDLQ